EILDRKLFTQQQHHLSFLAERQASLRDTFFRISFSRVIRPRTCSSSATRDCSAVRDASLAKTVWARSRKVVFQRPSRLGLSPCLRQASACDWTPLSTSRTIRALNSGVN